MKAANRSMCINVTGVSVIDNQHEEIMRRLLAFKGLNGSSSIEETSMVLHELIEYVRGHFQFEEMMIEASDYPFSKSHRQLHSLFMDRLIRYQSDLRNGVVKSSEVSNFLRAWFERHMKTDDLNYVNDSKNAIEALLTDRSEQGWYLCAMRQCFPLGEDCDCAKA